MTTLDEGPDPWIESSGAVVGVAGKGIFVGDLIMSYIPGVL